MFYLKSLVALILLISSITLLISRGYAEAANQFQDNVLISNPDIVKMDLALITTKTKVDGQAPPRLGQDVKPYEIGQRVRIQLIATNNSPETVNAPVLDTYYQNRPELWRDEERVSYREDIEKLLPLKDTSPEFIRIASVPLRPYQLTKVEVLDLGDWYERLKPGT